MGFYGTISKILGNLFIYRQIIELYSFLAARWLNTKNKPYWQERADLIAEVRNPMMHIRSQNITADIRYRCEEYCQEMLKFIEDSGVLVKHERLEFQPLTPLDRPDSDLCPQE